VTSAYDAVAPSFDRHRMLPEGVPDAIRAAILAAVGVAPRPRILDLGAGSGRIGWPFVVAGDDYVGLDLSAGMLRAFGRRAGPERAHAPPLVQADGAGLPFGDGAFDVVMLIQIFGGLRDWQKIIGETRRVLRREGTLVVGRVVAPNDGVDAHMKQKLASMLATMGIRSDALNARDEVLRSLESIAAGATRRVAATWTAERTARGFLDRHRGGARFAALPASIRDEALHKLAVWAAATFGSLDAVFPEQQEFELRIFVPGERNGR
jgi:ubiquinone/menaquinone biosynthesis C-methylase UbiE